MEPRDQQTKFYQALFQECSEKAQVNVRAIHRAKDDNTVSAFIPLGADLGEQLAAFVRKWNTKKDYIGVYHAVATRNGGGKKEHIVEIPALWAEIDYKDTPEVEAKNRLGEFPFPPSAVVNSGGGLHNYWFLKEPATKEDIPKVEKVLKQLVAALGADPSAAEAARILRIPGTINRKYEEPREVKLAYCYSEKRYNLEDISDFLPDIPDTPETSFDSTEGNEADRLVNLCTFMQHCDENRKILSEPEWYCMVSNLARCQGGPRKIHDLSRGYPGYSREETNSKILHAIDAASPHTCEYIKRLWPHEKNCGVKAPVVLVRRHAMEETLLRWEPLSLSDTTISAFLSENPPEREYYFEDLIPRRIVGNISARGGASKSFLIITLCMGLSTGKQVLGFNPTRATKVLALFAEDSQPELHRRIRFTANTLFPDMDNTTRGLLVENFHAKSVDGMVGGLMAMKDGNPVLAPKYEWLCETIEAHEGLELLFLDPKSRFYGLDELNNDHNTMWLISLEHLRNRYGVDVIFTHHVSQSQGDRLIQTAARGGTALIDGVRWAANLRTLSEKDGKRFSLEDYRRYVEFDVTKSNYAPMLPRSLYFKREAEGVLMPVDLRNDRLKQIADELTRLCHELFLSDGTMFAKRELTQRKEGAELRQTMKELIPSCTAKDIAEAVDYALREGMAELVPDPEKPKRKLFRIKEVTK